MKDKILEALRGYFAAGLLKETDTKAWMGDDGQGDPVYVDLSELASHIAAALTPAKDHNVRCIACHETWWMPPEGNLLGPCPECGSTLRKESINALSNYLQSAYCRHVLEGGTGSCTCTCPVSQIPEAHGGFCLRCQKRIGPNSTPDPTHPEGREGR